MLPPGPALQEPWSPEDKLCRAILNWLSRESLWNAYHYDISRALYSLVRDQGKDCAFLILPDANKVVSNLWDFAARIEGYKENSKDWIQYAINCTPGVLAELWLRSVTHWRKQQDPKPERLSDEYRQELDKIVQEQNAAGGIALSILASQFSFFLSKT